MEKKDILEQLPEQAVKIHEISVRDYSVCSGSFLHIERGNVTVSCDEIESIETGDFFVEIKTVKKSVIHLAIEYNTMIVTL